MSDWATATYERFGRALKHWRGVRGMSAQQLSDRTTELGYPVSRGVIANWESGRKAALDICELIILAEALGVDPPVLLYPDLLATEVECLPGIVESSADAVRMFCGTDPSTTHEPLRVLWDYDEAVQRQGEYEQRGNTDAAIVAERLAKSLLAEGIERYSWQV